MQMRSSETTLTAIQPHEKAVMQPRNENRDWARKLIRRHESGEYRSTPTALQMARNALGIGEQAAV
jgi:hypothetical protein